MKEEIVSLLSAILIENLKATELEGASEKRRLEIIDKIEKKPLISVIAKAIEDDVTVRAVGGAGHRTYFDLRRALLFTYRNNLDLGARIALDHGVSMLDALTHCDMHEAAASMKSKVDALLAKLDKKVIHE